MKEIKLQNKRFPRNPLHINYYPARVRTPKIMVIIGGSGDRRKRFDTIVKSLKKIFKDYDIVTYSFRGVEEGKEYPLKQLSIDLEELLIYFQNQKKKIRITLIATSLGAYPACFLAISEKFEHLLDTIVFLDPADYYLHLIYNFKKYPWSGPDTYNPNRKTISMLLKGISSKLKVHVVHFTIRDYGSFGYVSCDKRSQDNPKLFPRQSTDMVRSFYENTPKKNRGKYIEINTIPHGFLRDGDIKANEETIVRLINRCLS